MAMASQILELTLISASDLKKVTFFSRMRVDAVASISGGDSHMPTHCTQVDRESGRNPVWNAVLHFPIPANVDARGLALHVLLRSEAPFFLGHRNVGEVFVPLHDLLAGATDSGEPKTVSYQVRRPLSGHAHGVLYFSYKFTGVQADVVAAANAAETKEGQYIKYVRNSEKAMVPATAYPERQADVVAAANAAETKEGQYIKYVRNSEKAMVPATAYPERQPALAYPPVVHYGAPYAPYPPQPYGYAPQPPYGYNAAPPPVIYGYAAPPMVAPARQRRGMGMGLGLGLLSGAVGGMMLGDMVGDFEAEAAYDAGFSDGLGL